MTRRRFSTSTCQPKFVFGSGLLLVFLTLAVSVIKPICCCSTIYLFLLFSAPAVHPSGCSSPVFCLLFSRYRIVSSHFFNLLPNYLIRNIFFIPFVTKAKKMRKWSRYYFLSDHVWCSRRNLLCSFFFLLRPDACDSIPANFDGLIVRKPQDY